MTDLEQVAKPEEQPKPSSEKEQVKETPKESKDATLGKTYTAEEFQKAQSGWDKQITLSKADAVKAQGETEKLKRAVERMETSHRKLEEAHEKLIGDQDPDALEGYKRQRSQAAWEAERDRREADFAARESDLEQGREANRLALKAFEIAQEKGVPIDKLKACATEREMELVAELYQKPEETQTVDPGISTAGGGGKLTADQVKNMSPQERFERREEIANMPLVKE